MLLESVLEFKIDGFSNKMLSKVQFKALYSFDVLGIFGSFDLFEAFGPLDSLGFTLDSLIKFS